MLLLKSVNTTIKSVSKEPANERRGLSQVTQPGRALPGRQDRDPSTPLV